MSFRRIKGDTYMVDSGLLHCCDCHKPICECKCEGYNIPFDPLRRCDINRMSMQELQISKAIDAVEELGCDTLLTQAVVLLGNAKDKLADYIDSQLAKEKKDVG